MEYSYFIRSNNIITITAITIVFIGIIIRGLSIKYLGKYFSREVETWDDHTLIKDGIYKYIRHPAYLGNILQIIGFPLILNSYYSLVLSALMIYLFLKRIEVEEKFLAKKLPEYKSYQKDTYKMIPYIW
jgi:protein-S-isoprenylcysteine O-methyltransferase Ste14